jgi:hypothetical protein
MKLILALTMTAWLVIGIVASGQRGYFGNEEKVSCKTGADIGLTILIGPVNYLGVNPTVDCPDPPNPSS